MDKAIKNYEKATGDALKTQRNMNQEWRVTHPNLSQLSRGLDKVSSAAYRLKGIYDTVNLAFIRQNTTGSKEAQLLNQKAVLARELADIQNAPDYVEGSKKELELKQQIAALDEEIKTSESTQLGSILDTAIQIGITVPLAAKGIKDMFDAASSLSKVNFTSFINNLTSITGKANTAAGAVGSIGAPIKGSQGIGTVPANFGTSTSTAGKVAGAAIGAAGIVGGSYLTYQGAINNDPLGILAGIGIAAGTGAAGGAMVGGPFGAAAGAAIGAVSASATGLITTQQQEAALDASIDKNMSERTQTLQERVDARNQATNKTSTSSSTSTSSKPKNTISSSSKAKINSKPNALGLRFADGGIIEEPTMLIGLNSGGIGLMGEEGPEMITPMKRGGGATYVTNVYVQGSVITTQQLASIVSKQQAVEYNRRYR